MGKGVIMKVLFPLLYIAEHSGDNAIWKKLISIIESVYPNSEYICPTQFSPTQTDILKWDIDQLKEVTPNIKVIPSGLVNGFNATEFRKLQTKEEVIAYMDKVTPSKDLAEADMIISMGGGYMFADALYCLYLPPFYVAQKLGKPTFFNTQTFSGSDLTPATKILSNIVFNRANYISPREQSSAEYLRQTLGVTNELTLSQDFTFDIPPEPYDKPLPEDSIKINIRQDKSTEHSIEIMANVADMIIETMRSVVFVPICHGGERDDRVIHRKIASKMKHECLLIEDRITIGQAITIAKSGIFITDRYHTSIFSALANTPFVPLFPDINFKMQGLLDALDYPNRNIINLNQTTVEAVFKYVLDVWDNKESIKSQLEISVPKIIQEVTDNTNKLKIKLKEVIKYE